METWTQIILIVLGILLPLREGLKFRKGLRKYWKFVGLLTRSLLVALAYPNILTMLILANLLWTGYDIMCAWGLRQKWYYLGTTSLIDKFRILNYILKILLLILTLTYIIINY